MALRFIKLAGGAAIIESDCGGPGRWSAAVEELLQPATKEFARSEAAKLGMINPACGIVAGAYPVDKTGEVVAPNMDPNTIAGYRIDIPVVQAIR